MGESFYSIQFFPAYAIALTARAFGLSTSAAFAVLMLLIALGSSLILFSLILSVTGDRRLAAAAVLFVLCLGSVPTLWGLLQILRGLPPDFTHLRFLRRFAPGAAFPFVLAFYALVWRALKTSNRTTAYISSVLAGGVFAVLVFSYFYFWTAALAWISCLGLLWVIGKPDGWQRGLKLLGLTAVPMIAALLPYAWLLSKRSPNQIAVTILAQTRAPDLLRIPQLLSVSLLALLIVLSRYGLFDFRRQTSLFATSFVILPFLLFNQQIVTGLSLQPTHYEVFVANYSVLLATALIAGLLWSRLTGARRRAFDLSLILVAVLSLAWGMFEVGRSTAKFTPAFITRDEATPAARRLVDLAKSSANESTVILATDPVVADFLPTIAPQPLLWAPHMYGFADVSPAADKRRLSALLYYTGVHFEQIDARRFEALDADRKFYFSALIGAGRSRTAKSLSNTWKPVTVSEYESAQLAYNNFVAGFNRETASQPLLSYLLVAQDKHVELSNFDRWYERTEQEHIGKYILYRVKLRP